MNATLPPLYTNELSAEVLRTLDKSSFTDQQLVGLNEQGLAIVNQQQAYTKSHPLSLFTERQPMAAKPVTAV